MRHSQIVSAHRRRTSISSVVDRALAASRQLRAGAVYRRRKSLQSQHTSSHVKQTPWKTSRSRARYCDPHSSSTNGVCAAASSCVSRGLYTLPRPQRGQRLGCGGRVETLRRGGHVSEESAIPCEAVEAEGPGAWSIEQLLQSVRGFERAVCAWHGNELTPEDFDQSFRGVQACGRRNPIRVNSGTL